MQKSVLATPGFLTATGMAQKFPFLCHETPRVLMSWNDFFRFPLELERKGVAFLPMQDEIAEYLLNKGNQQTD